MLPAVIGTKKCFSSFLFAIWSLILIQNKEKLSFNPNARQSKINVISRIQNALRKQTPKSLKALVPRQQFPLTICQGFWNLYPNNLLLLIHLPEAIIPFPFPFFFLERMYNSMITPPLLWPLAQKQDWWFRNLQSKGRWVTCKKPSAHLSTKSFWNTESRKGQLCSQSLSLQSGLEDPSNYTVIHLAHGFCMEMFAENLYVDGAIIMTDRWPDCVNNLWSQYIWQEGRTQYLESWSHFQRVAFVHSEQFLIRFLASGNQNEFRWC